jgi:hypothetical protein
MPATLVQVKSVAIAPAWWSDATAPRWRSPSEMLSRSVQMAPACALSCATVPSATMPDLQTASTSIGKGVLMVNPVALTALCEVVTVSQPRWEPRPPRSQYGLDPQARHNPWACCGHQNIELGQTRGAAGAGHAPHGVLQEGVQFRAIMLCVAAGRFDDQVERRLLAET